MKNNNRLSKWRVKNYLALFAATIFFATQPNHASTLDDLPADELINEGVDITFIDAVSEIDQSLLNPRNTLVVYTPAIPENNQLLRFFIAENYPVLKRAKLLGEVTKNTLCLAVAGTHGKTTTSAILGHILAECNMPVTAFLGGIAENYNSNFISIWFR